MYKKSSVTFGSWMLVSTSIFLQSIFLCVPFHLLIHLFIQYVFIYLAMIVKYYLPESFSTSG